VWVGGWVEEGGAGVRDSRKEREGKRLRDCWADWLPLSLLHLHTTSIPQHSRANLAVTLQFGVEATHWGYQADFFSSKALVCLYFNYTTFKTTHKTQLCTLLSLSLTRARVVADMAPLLPHNQVFPSRSHW
jgi:hypothetical protein